ncbi:probable 3',5'-cyclic phosphodiesterase pde-5 isoform X2 [Ischnura elegans]|uniref:probable 3',5'-cyclic phosphodiesterase pde-5 isoform X2 n=1 Tax=Ischnura elegans TaxID=197161 RepID=UPI001ED89351|nr:probable 3',5'-cyclic phosphodiesterase pde-5 isoform X2 [Ischnura elegans]
MTPPSMEELSKESEVEEPEPSEEDEPSSASPPPSPPQPSGSTGTGEHASNGVRSAGIGDLGRNEEPSVDAVTAFLRSHPDYLEKYLMEEVELDTLERWMIRRTQRAKTRGGGPDSASTGKIGRKTSLSRWKFCVHADKRQMLQELTQSLHQERPNKAHVLWELASCISSAVGADGFRLHMPERPEPVSPPLAPPAAVELPPAKALPPGQKDFLSEDTCAEGGDDIITSEDVVSLYRPETKVIFVKTEEPESEEVSSLPPVPPARPPPPGTPPPHVTWAHPLAAYVAKTKEALRLSRNESVTDSQMAGSIIYADGPQLSRIVSEEKDLSELGEADTKENQSNRRKRDIGASDHTKFQVSSSTLTQASVQQHELWKPMIQCDGELAGVLEMWRTGPSSAAFHEEDEEIVSSYLVWGGIALHYAQLYLSMDKQRKLNDFLLAVVKSIFQDMVSMDALVIKVMNFAQRLVDADRASLFLVDNKSRELYARIFDVGGEDADSSNGMGSHPVPSVATEIRFPLGTGIAGQVAMTGEVLNIEDAYSDPRFNRTVDQLTGYHTHSILCMPIFIRGSVIGVVQMVNKHSGRFTKEDEEAFETFAVYCGLALHHAKLYDKIRRSEQKYRVAMEVLSYHNTCAENEVELMKQKGIPETRASSLGVDDYHFSVFTLDDFQKAQYAVFMFKDLFGLSRFDADSLIRFMLTVKKNYRRVPYHNWTHGFSVANSMYTIVKRANVAFNTNESLALYIGSLCHDLDHRGKNNKFMLDTESPLACIYSTSTMEHHHFNQTVTILQQEGHNIFSKLSSEEYKNVLGLIKHCILATDLALFFPNKARLTQLVNDNKFSWENMEHRLLLQAVTMTASDLSASTKPWDVQVETVKVIFEEFYEQGDAERAAGRVPIPMMDRHQPDQQAASQVGFLTGICIPCYELLYKLVPETKPMLEKCQENLARWREIDRSQKEKATGVR